MGLLVAGLCLLTVVLELEAFNIETSPWIKFSDQAKDFGYRVLQLDTSRLLVSAPLERKGRNRGLIYRCDVGSKGCSALQISVPDYAVNMSLGLSMAVDSISDRALVCGPTIPRDCESITTYNGLCFELDSNLRVNRMLPTGLRDCPKSGTDIAFLLDGSGSVKSYDFIRMKKFVQNLITQFIGRNTQFAAMQYSHKFQTHFTFSEFMATAGSWQHLVDGIQQLRGPTHTPTAIRKVVRELFVASRGARDNVNKVLLVITDGKTYGDNTPLADVVAEAEGKGIVRYAIGVGEAFSDTDAKRELNTIGSWPSKDYVFQVQDFSALESIRQALQDKIFAIEGTQTVGGSFETELAQEGFSSAFFSRSPILGVVGAFDWTGGYLRYEGAGNRSTFVNHSASEKDSYLGYSMAVGTTNANKYIILGAPRAGHKGQVVVFSSKMQTIDGTQIGSYFGAEVCVVDVDSDSSIDLLLIGAPMFYDGVSSRQGQVKVCPLSSSGRFVCADNTLQGADGVQFGRFGASLAQVLDLNGDGLVEVAVGAPLEDGGQGSVYIFHGRRGGVDPTFSQRIAGSSVSPGLQYFGQSLSSSQDLSGDSLTDIAVGSRGSVLLLRSRPVLLVKTQVTYSPSKISTESTDCKATKRNEAKVCFQVSKVTKDNIGVLQATINYTLTLDATRLRYRAHFTPNTRQLLNTVRVGLGLMCLSHPFEIPNCPEDSLSSLSNELQFSMTGLPSSSADSLSPILDPGSGQRTFFPLDFERQCGADEKCVDNLKVDFNFSRVPELQVGISPVLNLTVAVENIGEDSYNSRVIFTYPSVLSYRRNTLLQFDRRATVQCEGTAGEETSTLRNITCLISKPILKGGSRVVFLATFDVDSSSQQWSSEVTISANATSSNEEHATTQSFVNRTLPVKLGINVLVKNELDESTSYVNFSAGRNDLRRPVHHVVQVENQGLRSLPVTVTIRVPVRLGDRAIWTDSSVLKIANCTENSKRPTVSDFVKQLKTRPLVDCSVAECKEFTCSVPLLESRQKLLYNLSGTVSSAWIELTQLQSVNLVTLASLQFDTKRFIHVFTTTQEDYIKTQVETRIELYTEYDYKREIIGGAAGGLLLLALITAGLYKAGFFKRGYKQMMEQEAGEKGAGEEAEAGEEAPPAAE